MEYQQYPLAMSHPAYKPATISGYRRNPDGSAANDPPGKPAQFPPVHVNNRDQELQYASMGYLPDGVPDPAAYMTAVLGADEPVTYGYVEYPKWVYQVDANDELQSRLLNTEAEEKNLRGKWFANPDAAYTAYDEGLGGAISTEEKRGPGRPKKIDEVA